MKIPDKVVVLGLTYPIKYEEDLLEKESHWGETRFIKQEIAFDKSCSTERLIHTFMHEVIEAINERLDINLRHHQINLLEYGLTQFLKDNQIDFKEP